MKWSMGVSDSAVCMQELVSQMSDQTDKGDVIKDEVEEDRELCEGVSQFCVQEKTLREEQKEQETYDGITSSTNIVPETCKHSYVSRLDM